MKFTFTLRFFFAALALILFEQYDKVGAMLLAGTILTFPSWKFYRGRLAIGGQEEKSPEILAIEEVSKQVGDFNKKLGERAEKKEVAEVKDLLEDLKKNIGKYTEKEIDAALDKINKNTEKMATQIGEMLEDVQKSKETSGRKVISLFDDADLQKQVKEMFPDLRTKTKSTITIPINRDMVLRTKAAETMGYPQFFEGIDGVVTDWTAFTGRVIDPRLYERKRKRNFILDNFSIPTIDAPTLIYLEKIEVAGVDASEEDSGSAEWITSGEAKPMRSFRVTSNKVEAKKVAIFGTVEDKLLRDVPSLSNWIQTDFTQEIREAYNDGLLNNDPGVDEDAPLGLKQNAVQYSDIAAFVIASANDIDAIIAAIAQLERNNEEAAYVAVSSDKWFQLLALKDSQLRYQNNNLVYTSNSGQLFIAGVPIVKADVNDIPTANLLAVGADGFQIRNYGPLVFEAGLNGEDFRNDRTSFRGYQEVLSYIPSHRYESVIYDTFSNIKTAIST